MDPIFSIPWSRIFSVVTDIHFFALMAKKDIQNYAKFGTRVYFLRKCPNWRQLKDTQDTTRALKTL
jgi:hypothetical protein